jgi:hypothetical protein
VGDGARIKMSQLKKAENGKMSQIQKGKNGKMSKFEGYGWESRSLGLRFGLC